MNIENLNTHLKNIIQLRNVVKEVKKNSNVFSLKHYFESFRNEIGNFEHGERDKFTVPYYTATFKFDDINSNNYSFSVEKTMVLSCLNKYIKGMQRGLVLHENELNATQQKIVN